MLRTTLFIAALAAPLAAAQGHEARPTMGGRIVDVGPYHAELVTRARVVDVYVTDENARPVPAARLKGSAILMVEGRAVRVPLGATDGNRLSGAAAQDIGAAPRGVVQITAPDGTTASGRLP